MPIIPQFTRGTETSSPRSIIGALLTLYAVVVAAAAAVAIGLATTGLSGLVVWILVFIAVITIALGGAIIVITWKDPSRLMLGPVTGREFAALRYIKLGDDVSGERVERLLGPTIEGGTVEGTPVPPQIEPPEPSTNGEET